MNPNITRIIEQYLQDELNTEDKIAFEKRLEENVTLKEEVLFQKTIHEAAKRASMRSDIKKTARKYHYSKLMKWGGLSLGILIAVSLFVINSNDNLKKKWSSKVSEKIQVKIPDNDLINGLSSQLFSISKEGAIVLSKEGILISTPKGAFLENGKVYNGEAILKFQEAMDAISIVKSGLSTMSGDRLLETQGMFSFDAYTPEGKHLDINPKVGIYMQVPVDEYKKGMQLFDGVKHPDGTIDWQNPEKLAKLPVITPMTDLDFYPVGYETHLDKIKWSKSKKKRDSLYLSFEEPEYRNSLEDFQDTNEEGIIKIPQRKITLEENNFLYGNNMPIDKNMTYEEAYSLAQWAEGPYWKRDFEKIAEEFYFIDKKDSKRKMRPLIVNDSIDIEYIASISEDEAVLSFIPPSKVLAFWKPKFNNTNISTRDFEKRMRAIHSTCNKSVLKKYTSQLSKPISQIDKEVVAMGYKEFESFALENVGAVNPNNPHIKALEKFYQDGIKDLKKQAKQIAEKENRRKGKWDEKVKNVRTKESTRKIKRDQEALLEEYKFNMRNVKKQIGKTIGFTLRHSPKGTIKNIDAYVWDATVNRTSMDRIDPASGKRVKITYNTFSLLVPNSKKYIKLYAYLFPHQLKSFQRIKSKNGAFDYPLNDDILYDIGLIGLTEDGYEYFQKQTFKKGELGEIKMKRVSEVELNESILQLNRKRSSHSMSIKDEMDWLLIERKDYIEQKRRKKMTAFRKEIRKILFPCYKERELPQESYTSAPNE